MPQRPRATGRPDQRPTAPRRPGAQFRPLEETFELAPGYQSGRGRGYATERAYQRLYASEQDLLTPERERGLPAREGAWGQLTRRRLPPGASPEAHQGRGPAPGRPTRGVGPHAGRGPASYRRSDDRIYEALCDELMLQPDIDPSEVTVRVEEGVVTVTGQVPDRWTKFAIEEVAESTLGVLDVHNRLRLRSADDEEERRLGSHGSEGRRGLH